jgi:hypothetical protein
MELPQRHRAHGVRIRKEEINGRKSEIRKHFLKSELRVLCVSVVIIFSSVSSLRLRVLPLCALLTEDLG